MALGLIDKLDNFEVVRNQIAGILASETTKQQALAVTAGKDPALWKLRIFAERSNPWEEWTNDQTDESPIINIWFDRMSFRAGTSNISERQVGDAIFNIDCYGIGISEQDGVGHKAGDEQASYNAQRALRLVRNILMASEFTYLQLRGLVWQRWPQQISMFRPQQSTNMFQVIAARFALEVSFNEYAPQFTGDTLNYVAIDVLRKEDGSIYCEADYDYNLP